MLNLHLFASKFCETSAAESALLYIDACDMFPEKKLLPVCSDPILNCVGVVKELVPPVPDATNVPST
jgi:hypothetical protein